MNYFKITILILLSTHIISAQEYQSKSELENEILGTWYYDNDLKSKITFSENGTVKRFFENELQSTATFEITSSCDGEELPDNQFFLKETDENGSSCSYIEAINFNENGIFSLMTKSQGRVIVLKRSE